MPNIGKELTIRPWLIIAAAVLVFSVDRWLKSIAWAMEGGSGAPVEYALFRNYGVAFSLPAPDAAYWPVAAAAVAFLMFLAARDWSRGQKAGAAVTVVVLMGAASNLIDRYILGYTIDYIIFFGISAINLADGLIVGGVAFLLWREFRRPQSLPRSENRGVAPAPEPEPTNRR